MNDLTHIDFFMPMKKPPTTTHQDKETFPYIAKDGSLQVRHVDSDKSKETRAKLMAELSRFAPTKQTGGFILFPTGPLRCTVKWCFPRIKRSMAHKYMWKDTKPDTHNLNKMLFDCMTTLRFWKDDAQVASEIIEKFWAERTGIYIKIEKL